MREEWLEVSVTFDERHGYIASAPELRSPVVRSLTNGLPSRTNVCSRRKRTCGPQGGSPGLDPERTQTLYPTSFGSVKGEDAAGHPFAGPIRHHPPR